MKEQRQAPEFLSYLLMLPRLGCSVWQLPVPGFFDRTWTRTDSVAY